MTSLQVGLIIAGVALVIGVLIYNWWQERRVRARIDATFDNLGKPKARPSAGASSERVEPTLKARAGVDEPMLTRAGGRAPSTESRVAIDAIRDEDSFAPPIKVQGRMAASDADASEPSTEDAELESPPQQDAQPVADSAVASVERVVHDDGHGLQPDPDIECIVTLQPAKPVPVGALAAALTARVGKRLRWFGRRGASMPWQLLKADTTGDFSEVIACLLLADRTGAASVPMLQGYAALLAKVAPGLPATFIAPDVQREAARAETLDRMCADLDVQIGLTIFKGSSATIPGTRLRGVAEAAGFRLAAGRFEWVQEESGAVLYALQNFRAEPFTPDYLRSSAIPGAVFLLDVPRVAEPARVFDQMKLAAKRMAHTLDAALVDDNRRPLDDAGLATIRAQIQKTADALRAVHIEPGSPRALALFGS
ncbi:MAG: cell division protein ZipA C-terminal FtsZ-binding domain-containing protein [Pseudomonadota bacterium]|nr:cell division protein ZipA C-terminal FtsZ-binding domain-containing protein [Pseudomonadota bacterium]